MKGFTAGPISEATVGGHPAKAFRLTNDITLEQAQQCEGSPLDPWESGFGPITTNQGATDQFWVVDVNGTPITINASTFPLRLPPASGMRSSRWCNRSSSTSSPRQARPPASRRRPFDVRRCLEKTGEHQRRPRTPA